MHPHLLPALSEGCSENRTGIKTGFSRLSEASIPAPCDPGRVPGMSDSGSVCDRLGTSRSLGGAWVTAGDAHRDLRWGVAVGPMTPRVREALASEPPPSRIWGAVETLNGV